MYLTSIRRITLTTDLRDLFNESVLASAVQVKESEIKDYVADLARRRRQIRKEKIDQLLLRDDDPDAAKAVCALVNSGIDVRVMETSMLDCFGLKGLYKVRSCSCRLTFFMASQYLSLPYLRMKQRAVEEFVYKLRLEQQQAERALAELLGAHSYVDYSQKLRPVAK